ncbi:MAG: hypothetical protein JJE48_08110 [Actinobacteria bacterium]|nr:hypothetical protein [Actinomycetota bacterium]
MANTEDKIQKEDWTPWVDEIIEKSGSVQEAVELLRKERKIFLLLWLPPLLLRLLYELFTSITNRSRKTTAYMIASISLGNISAATSFYATIRFGKILGFGIYKRWVRVFVLWVLGLFPSFIYTLVKAKEQIKVLTGPIRGVCPECGAKVVEVEAGEAEVWYGVDISGDTDRVDVRLVDMPEVRDRRYRCKMDPEHKVTDGNGNLHTA